jgi:hypothetical protein
VSAFSDITSWMACVTVTSTSRRSLVLLGCYFCSILGTFSVGTVGTVQIRPNEKCFTNFISTLIIGVELQNAQFNTA